MDRHTQYKNITFPHTRMVITLLSCGQQVVGDGTGDVCVNLQVTWRILASWLVCDFLGTYILRIDKLQLQV